MTLDALVMLLWRRWWVLMLVALLGALVALGVTWGTTPAYTSTSISFVTALAPADKGASYESAQFAVSRAKSYPPLARSPEVLQAVIDELGLTSSATDLAKNVAADNPVDTLLINVTVEARTPDQSARIANAVARQMARRIQVLETDSGKRSSPVNVQLAVSASPPQVPSSPRPMVNHVLGSVCGGVLGVFIVLVSDALQRSRRARETERRENERQEETCQQQTEDADRRSAASSPVSGNDEEPNTNPGMNSPLGASSGQSPNDVGPLATH